VRTLKEGAAVVQIAHASAYQRLKNSLIRLEYLHGASMLREARRGFSPRKREEVWSRLYICIILCTHFSFFIVTYAFTFRRPLSLQLLIVSWSSLNLNSLMDEGLESKSTEDVPESMKAAAVSVRLLLRLSLVTWPSF
jgi:hypothetical protein